MRLSKAGVTLNVFMLEESEGLHRFMERLARIDVRAGVPDG